MDKSNWILEGIIFGAIMLIFSSIVETVIDGFTFDYFWIKILILLIGGLIFGLFSKSLREEKNMKKESYNSFTLLLILIH